MLMLGIETSCDETAAAVVENGRRIRSNILFTQEKIHGKFGGVVPELASRQHTAVISEVVRLALDKADVRPRDLSGVAVTQGPGLVGALLVGISFAKAFAYRQNIPLFGVHHLGGHLAAIRLEYPEIEWPAIGLVVSGGHTSFYFMAGSKQFVLIGRTIDDAAGEAFDKGAKMLGLPYPGGPEIDRAARGGGVAPVSFPRHRAKGDSLDVSFSGLKTSLRYYLERSGFDPVRDASDVPPLAAAYQQAIVDVLVDRMTTAADRHKVRSVLLTGGVAANSALRSRMDKVCRDRGWALLVPSPILCTDNGAMIAAGAFLKEAVSPTEALKMSPGAVPRLEDG